MATNIGSSEGFTLIELVIVIVILGVLAAVATPKFLNFKDEASVAASLMTSGAAAEHTQNNAACTGMGLSATKCGS